MKTVKPLRLSTMTRPFLKDGAQHLAMTCIAMTNLRGEPLLLPEPELWKIVGEELGSDAVLDLAMPKDGAEFLVTGSAYTRHQQDKTQCAVSVQVGACKKSLLVFGDRYWIDGRASEPQPFDDIRLDWRRAFGGPGFAENPAGIGHDDETINGLRVRKLPNIEHASDMLRRPGQTVKPAGLGPVDLARPSRMGRMGRQYDDNWRKDLFPGFSTDMDWHFFNAAPEDQWIASTGHGLAGAAYEICNMHPASVVQKGLLPDWRARCFVVRQAASRQLPDGLFEEVPLRLTTAWFFPHLERVVLIYHGSIGIEEDDASDISHMIAAMEEGTAPHRPPGYYREVLAQRCEPENGALFVLRDDQLLPADAIGPWLDADDEGDAPDPLTRNMQARADGERTRLAEAMKASGADPDKYRMPAESGLQKTPSVKELPVFVAKVKAMAQEQRQKLEQARTSLAQAATRNADRSAKMGFDTSTLLARADAAKGKGPPNFDPRRHVRGIEGVAAAVGAPALSAQKQEELRKVTQSAQEDLGTAYRRTAHYQEAADPMLPEQADRVRAQVERIMAGARDFSGMNLTGANLRGMDLRNTRWHRALLEGADLGDACMDNADFGEAVLARARMHGASLRGAIFDRCNLALAQCEGADFTGASFKGTTLDNLSALRCNFSAATLEDLHLIAASFEDCNFEQAKFSLVSFFEKSMLRGNRFDGAKLHKLSITECHASDLSFANAELESCVWVDVEGGHGLDFSGARMTTTCFAGRGSLVKARFANALLKDCNLRGMPLDEADFTHARLENSDFSGASMRSVNMAGADAPGSLFVRSDLTGASLQHADLSGAILQKALLVSADLRSANLFRADVSQSLVDDRTRFDGAYIEQIKTVPQRKKEKAA